MKLANFRRNGEARVRCGLVEGDTIVDLTAANGALSALGGPVASVEDVLRIEGGIERLRDAVEAARANGALDPHRTELGGVTLTAPVLHPQKVIGIGFNYLDHAEETSTPLPVEPLFFAMFASAIAGPFDPIVKPANVEMLDYEGELAIVIGKTGRNIPEERALEHVAGYTVLDDVSARNFQMSDSQWLRVKSQDSFAPMGPWMVTADELGNGAGLSIECRVNGEVRQRSNTKYLIFDVAKIVSYISSVMTLHPGDVISTGTPAGVGFAMSPQVFLKPGDVVEVEIEGIGGLRNTVVAAPGA